MQYLVVGNDGKEYGPVGMDALKQWAQEKRITPDSTLKNFSTGQTIQASAVSGLFAAPVSPPMVSRQGAPTPPYSGPGYSGTGELWGAIIRSILAVAVFFFLHGLGIIFGGY